MDIKSMLIREREKNSNCVQIVYNKIFSVCAYTSQTEIMK